MIQNTIFMIQQSVSMVQNYSCHGTERPYSGYRNTLYSIQDTEIPYTGYRNTVYSIQDTEIPYTEVQYSGNRNAVYRNTVSMKQIYSSHGTEIPYTGYRNTPYNYRIQKYRIATGYTSTVYRIQKYSIQKNRIKATNCMRLSLWNLLGNLTENVEHQYKRIPSLEYVSAYN